MFSITLNLGPNSEQPDAERQRAKLLLKTFTSVLAFDIFKMNLILKTRRPIVRRSASMIGTNLVSEKPRNILPMQIVEAPARLRAPVCGLGLLSEIFSY